MSSGMLAVGRVWVCFSLCMILNERIFNTFSSFWLVREGFGWY